MHSHCSLFFSIHQVSHRTDEYEYDVYVAVNLGTFDISDWFYNNLVPELEQKSGLRLYARERDALPGKVTPQGIHSAMNHRRAFLYILDRGFAMSQLNNEELEYGIGFAEARKIPIVIIRPDDTPVKEFSSTARVAIQKYPCFVWNTHRPASSFWDDVKEALKGE